jgi:hypothetical protein
VNKAVYSTGVFGLNIAGGNQITVKRFDLIGYFTFRGTEIFYPGEKVIFLLKKLGVVNLCGGLVCEITVP